MLRGSTFLLWLGLGLVLFPLSAIAASSSQAVPGYLGIVPVGMFQQPVSSLTHFFGALMFAYFSGQVWRRSDKLGLKKKSAILLFLASVVFMFTMSGIYHMTTPVKVVLSVTHKLDHIGITFFVAAYFTVIHTLLYKGFWRFGFLTMIWAVCLSSVLIKTMFFGKFWGWYSLLFYLGIGSFGFITAAKLAQDRGFKFFKELAASTAIIFAAAVLDKTGKPVLIEGYVGPHEIFHIVALLGMWFHYRFVSRVILAGRRISLRKYLAYKRREREERKKKRSQPVTI